MITLHSINHYKGAIVRTEANCLYIPPHALLRPYISHYTVSFPTPQIMSDAYTVLPSASSTLCVSVNGDSMISALNGTNTKADTVGAAANKMKLLLLVKFNAGGFFPFSDFAQSELINDSLALCDIDKKLASEIENELIKSECMEALVDALDRIFINRLKDCYGRHVVAAIINRIIAQKGNIHTRELSSAFFYSEKHMRRLFLQHVGTTPKMFSRIVRINHALHFLQCNSMRLTDIAERTGFFDQSHFIHDFKTILGLTPQKYLSNMSDFYIDDF